MHIVYECEANEGDVFQQTAHLVPRAQRECPQWECFWLRGLMPHTWLPQVHEELEL